MGLIASKIVRYSRRFNIENRAHRLIEKETIRPAPKYPSFNLEMTRAKELGFDQTIHAKNENLERILRDVYVKSTSDNPKFESDLDRPNLLRRTFESQDPLISHKEPPVIPDGKCTVKQAMKILCDHRENPVVYNAETISNQYKLPIASVQSVLKYFSVFSLYEPETGKNKTKQTVAVLEKLPTADEKKRELIRRISQSDRRDSNS